MALAIATLAPSSQPLTFFFNSAVVAHGDILRCLTQKRNTTEPWANAEVREYTFTSDSDDDASIELVKPSKQPIVQEGKEEPTSSDMKN